MKLHRIVLTVLFIVATTVTNAQLISGDVKQFLVSFISVKSELGQLPITF